MTTVLVRRRKLGRTSCREIKNRAETPFAVVRHWRDQYPEDTEMVIRWGCTANVPVRNVLNKSEAIGEVNDKKEFRKKLEANNLCPKTWFGVMEFRIQDRALYPLLVRPSNHAQGRRFHICNTPEELLIACNRYRNYYISELIEKVAEYRVFVVSGRVACVAKKTPGNPEDIAWNVARGGRFDNVRWDEWPLKAVRCAVEAFQLSSLDFGGVDVMVDAQGNSYVVEINSAPSLTSDYRQSCMAKCFDYIVRNGKDRIPLTGRRGGYRKFVHPAVCDRAILV